MNNIVKIDSNYSKTLITKIRDMNTKPDELKSNLISLGNLVVQEIIGDQFTKKKIVTTPLNFQFEGLELIHLPSIVISTKDEYENFANSIASQLINCKRGFMEFSDSKSYKIQKNSSGSDFQEMSARKKESIYLPPLEKDEHIETVIIAKSVIATCNTAYSLAKEAIKRYNPNNTIFASVFYSEKGINTLIKYIPECKIYIVGDPDGLNKEGLLEPGIGNLDIRLNKYTR